MTRLFSRLRRASTLTPAWAVHFHEDGPPGGSTACFDARCGLPPLAVSGQPRFVADPPLPPGRPAVAAQPPRWSPTARRPLAASR